MQGSGIFKVTEVVVKALEVPAWSRGDEQILKGAINHVDDLMVDLHLLKYVPDLQ